MATVSTNFTPQQLADEILSEALLVRIGTDVVAIIKARTDRGEFLEGSTAGSEKYSTKKAHMPLGALYALVGKTNGNKAWQRLKGDNLYRSSSTGKVWIILEGGYRELREIGGRETNKVTLNWKGTMMRALHYRVNASEKSVTVFFTDTESAQKATWLTEGAGRNKIKRSFIALSTAELSGMVKEAEAAIRV